MYDVYQTRQAAINEMREMAARPFAQVQLNTHIPPEIFDEQPQPVFIFSRIKFLVVLILIYCIGVLRSVRRQHSGCGDGLSRFAATRRWFAPNWAFFALFRLCHDKCMQLVSQSECGISLLFSLTRRPNRTFCCRYCPALPPRGRTEWTTPPASMWRSLLIDQSHFLFQPTSLTYVLILPNTFSQPLYSTNDMSLVLLFGNFILSKFHKIFVLLIKQ